MLAPRDNHLDKAWSVAFQVLHGRLTLADLEKQVTDSSGAALQARVDTLRKQLAFENEQDNDARLRSLFVELAHENGKRLPFEQFQRVLEQELAGIVLTAHPTFSLSPEANAAAATVIVPPTWKKGKPLMTVSRSS